MIGKNDLIDFIKQNKEYFRTELHVEKIGIFGSFVRGDQREDSDIDLVIEFEKDVEDVIGNKEKLRNSFKAIFHRNVDIAREKYLRPYAKKLIINEVEYIE